MNLSDAHLASPSDADLLRGAADALRMAYGCLKRVGPDAMGHERRRDVARDIQRAEMECDECAAEWGAKQAAAVAKTMPS